MRPRRPGAPESRPIGLLRSEVRLQVQLSVALLRLALRLALLPVRPTPRLQLWFHSVGRNLETQLLDFGFTASDLVGRLHLLLKCDLRVDERKHVSVGGNQLCVNEVHDKSAACR